MSLRLATLLALACLAPAAACAGDAAADGAVAAARAAVEQRLGHGYEHLQLDVTTRPEHLPAAKGALEFRALPIAGRWPRARFTAMVEVRSGGRVLRTVPVGFALSATGQAWVYRDDVVERLPADQLQLEERNVDVALGSSAPLASPDALKGKRLRHPVRAGQVASIEDFEDVPDVDNRQQVRLMASYGGITVERAGVAMRAANKGETVPVQVAGTSEPVKATVTDRGVAQVVP
ncbi:flagellar basal body P-ring formation protein FlgA [Dyella marensis]|uniref:flagellar basal body P-ring formation chaperone FlgA n=1 Tax=Dyella marensis TaxID=500610 RepID=UPI0031D1B4B6